MTTGSSFSFNFELDRHLPHIQDEIVFGKYLQHWIFDIYNSNCNDIEIEDCQIYNFLNFFYS